MTNDKSGLFDEPTLEVTPTPAEAAPVQPATPVTNEPSPTDPIKPAETPPIEPVQVSKETPTVPLPKYLEAFHEARDLKRKLAELETQKTAPPPPNPVTNPQEFAQFQAQDFENKILDQKVSMSELMAKQVYGEALVKEAFTALYAKGDQYVAQQALKSAHPADEIVKLYKREQLLSSIGDNPDEFVRRRYAELNAATPPVQGAAPVVPIPPKPAPVAPPPSLSRAPSSGNKPSDTVATDGFDMAFTR